MSSATKYVPSVQHRLADDAAAHSPAPLLLPVPRIETVEKLVGRSDEHAIVERERRTGRSTQRALPDERTRGELVRDNATVLEGQIDAVGRQAGPTLEPSPSRARSRQPARRSRARQARFLQSPRQSASRPATRAAPRVPTALEGAIAACRRPRAPPRRPPAARRRDHHRDRCGRGRERRGPAHARCRQIHRDEPAVAQCDVSVDPSMAACATGGAPSDSRCSTSSCVLGGAGGGLAARGRATGTWSSSSRCGMPACALVTRGGRGSRTRRAPARAAESVRSRQERGMGASVRRVRGRATIAQGTQRMDSTCGTGIIP